MRWGKPRKNKKRIDPRYHLNEIEVVDLTQKPIKKTGYEGGEAYHLMPPEERRATKKSPYVKGDFKKFLATAQSSIQALFDEYKDYVWIFYDTETTGLGTGGYVQKTGEVKPAAKSFQVTQWGAAAVDFNDFEGEYEIVDTYNPKQHLDRAVKFRMGKEKERAAADEKAGKEKQPFERTVEFPLSMTRYGEKKKYDPETGKKTTASRFQTRLRNTLGFADFIKNAEEATGKPAILVAHNLPYDAKAIGSEFERARKEAWELRKRKITTYDEYAWMKDTLSATYPGLDTVQIFKQLLKPIVEKLKYFVETGVATEEEAAIVDNMITKAGNVSVSLGPTRQAFGVEDKGWHDALADVEMTMEVFDVVRMFIANYDPSLEDPKQMKLPFGEEGKNPEEDPQLTDHLREGYQSQGVENRERIGMQTVFDYMEEGGGGFKTPSAEDRIMQDIEDELEALEDKGTDIGGSKEELMKKFRRGRFAKRALRVKIAKMKSKEG